LLGFLRKVKSSPSSPVHGTGLSEKDSKIQSTKKEVNWSLKSK